MAFKCSYALIGDLERPVFKQPITDPGKDSKKGKLKLVKDGDSFKTVSNFNYTKEEFDAFEDQLQTVFLNGELLVDQKFSDIRARAAL